MMSMVDLMISSFGSEVYIVGVWLVGSSFRQISLFWAWWVTMILHCCFNGTLIHIVSPRWAPQPIHDKLDIVLQQRGKLKHLENNWVVNFAQTSKITKTSFTPKHWNISIPCIVSYQLRTTKDQVILHWLRCLGPTSAWESTRFSPRNRVGGMSNSGEGGEDPLRYTPLEDDKPSSSDIFGISWCLVLWDPVTRQYMSAAWVDIWWYSDTNMNFRIVWHISRHFRIPQLVDWTSAPFLRRIAPRQLLKNQMIWPYFSSAQDVDEDGHSPSFPHLQGVELKAGLLCMTWSNPARKQDVPHQNDFEVFEMVILPRLPPNRCGVGGGDI